MSLEIIFVREITAQLCMRAPTPTIFIIPRKCISKCLKIAVLVSYGKNMVAKVHYSSSYPKFIGVTVAHKILITWVRLPV